MFARGPRNDLQNALAEREERIAQLEEQLAVAARTDALTGLMGAAVFRKRLMDEVARSRRYRRPLSLAIVEVDGFAAYQRTHCYAAADQRLRRVSRRLGELVRGADVVSRASGPGFYVLMPETGAAGALRAAERFIEGLADLAPVSVGVAMREDVQTAEELEAAAAGAVAEARALGGERAVLAGSARNPIDVRSPEGLEALALALLQRDGYPRPQTEALLDMVAGVAESLDFDVDEVADVRTAALLRDLGKVALPDELLRKPGSLDAAAWARLREHPLIAERMVAAAGLGPVAFIVRHAHERFDGSGYPDGWSGEVIPLASRIVHACVAYHAMVSERPYRPAMTHERALDEMRRGAGSQFDPEVVAAVVGWLAWRMQAGVAVG